MDPFERGVFMAFICQGLGLLIVTGGLLIKSHWTNQRIDALKAVISAQSEVDQQTTETLQQTTTVIQELARR